MHERRRFRKLARRLFVANLPVKFSLQLALVSFLERFVGWRLHFASYVLKTRPRLSGLADSQADRVSG
jgi:hypothetical protein